MKHLLPSRAPRARTLFAVAASMLALPALALPAAANADIPINSFKAGPVAAWNNPTGFGVDITGTAPTSPVANDFNCVGGNPTLATQAGATTDYCITFGVTTGDPVTGEDLKSSVVGLPVGTLAAIDSAAHCDPALFARDTNTLNACPGATQVGTATASLRLQLAGAKTLPGRIYALHTPDGQAAQFGVALLSATAPPFTEIKFLINVTQLGVATIGLQNTTDTLAKEATGLAPFPLALAIDRNAFRFWGSAAAHPHASNAPGGNNTPAVMAADFFRVGTTCQTQQFVDLTVNPYTDSLATADSKPTVAHTDYRLTGCEGLKFDPGFSINLTGDQSLGGHPGLAVQITNAEGNDDLGGTKITLPAGITTDLKNVQNACPQDVFLAGNCTAATVAGSTTAQLSGVGADQVKGDVQLVAVPGQSLPALGLDYKGRLPLRVAGITTIDGNGQIVNTFKDLGSLPQRQININLDGGAKGILVFQGAGKCQASAYTTVLTSQNGKTANFSKPTACPANFAATLSNPSSRTPTLSLSGSGATGKKIQTLRATLPNGLTINKNRSKTGYTIKTFGPTSTKPVSSSRLSEAKVRFTITNPGSNGLAIKFKKNTLAATKSFAKSTKARTISVRIVYTDGQKVTLSVPLARKS
jgi:hypothetical protein